MQSRYLSTWARVFGLGLPALKSHYVMKYRQLNCNFVCSTRAFIFAKKPHMTPSEALALLAKLEGASKAEESYV